jgi:hypothetical protein
MVCMIPAWLASIRSLNTSDIDQSTVPGSALSAWIAAPVPRPPHPTSAIFKRSEPPACAERATACAPA